MLNRTQWSFDIRDSDPSTVAFQRASMSFIFPTVSIRLIYTHERVIGNIGKVLWNFFFLSYS